MPDQEEQKRKKKRALLALLVFLPLVRLRNPLAQASDDIEDSFDAIYDEYEDSADVWKAVSSGKSNLVDALAQLIGAGLLQGWKDGAKYTGVDETPDFSKLARAQGTKKAIQMLKTTKGWLKERGSDGYTLSSERAASAAKYAGAEAYFNGLAKAFKGQEGEWEKSWNTTSDDPCDDCLDNESMGFIPMDEEFESGHYAPLAHPNCACYLTVRRIGTGS